MSTLLSDDPRAIRTREAFQQAFQHLLEVKPFSKITVTDITRQAGYARHTFYNHYQTKEDLLTQLIDSVLADFISGLDNWNFNQSTSQADLQLFTSFFQVWQDHPEIVEILNKIDFDPLLIEQFKLIFTRFFYKRVQGEIPSVGMGLAKYVISFNAYALLGILKPWLQAGMQQTPEEVAGLLIQLTAPTQRMQTVEKYKHIFHS